MLNEKDKALKILIAIGMIIIIFTSIRATQSIIVPLLLSVFISLLTAPAISWLETKRIPRILAFLIVGGSVLVVMLAVASILSVSLGDFINDLPKYEKELATLTDSVIAKAQHYHIPISSRTQLMKHIDPSSVMGTIGSMLTNLSSLISNVLLIFFIVVFILFEAKELRPKFIRVTEMAGHKIEPSGIFIKVLKSYLLIKQCPVL